jgi:hypothetical protein
MTIKAICLLTVCCLLFSCRDNTKKVFYPSGKLKQEYRVDEKGLKQGEVISFYEDGTIRFKQNYINDTASGESTEYYPNGQIQIKGFFKNGLQEGPSTEYYQGGQIKARRIYVNGLENGEFAFYFSNGKLKMKGVTKDDTITLYYSLFDSLGNILEKKHRMWLHLLSELSPDDTIKVKAVIPGLYGNQESPVFILVRKNSENKEGTLPKMSFNPIDSAYYYSIPPLKDTGNFLININFFQKPSFVNKLDTVISISSGKTK